MSVIDLPDQGIGWEYTQCPNAPVPGAIGGYEYSGAQYQFLLQGSEFGVGDNKIHALKSTDLGVTWIDTDSIDIPPTVALPPGAWPAITYTTCMDGSTVYLMAADLDGTGHTTADATFGPLLLYKYDLTTNSFDAGGPASGAPALYKNWYATGYSDRNNLFIHLIRRGIGDMLLLYSGVETMGADKYMRVFVTTFNGSSCGGTGSMLPGQAGITGRFVERCAGMDASHNLHVIFITNDDSGHHYFFHVGMNSGGSFGTAQTIETDVYYVSDTSNLINFPAPADTIAFIGIRNRSSSNDNGDLAIYSAPGGSLTPTWTVNNILGGTPNADQDPRMAPDWIAGLGYLDGVVHVFWTQTGVSPSWNISSGMGQIRGSTAAATDLTTWSAETTIMGPFDAGASHWGAGQVAIWSGPVIGLGVQGNFWGNAAGTSDPIEMSKLLVYPPAGGGGMGIDCNAPPDGALGDPYSHPLTITGAPAGSTVAITGGALPPGLTIDDTGRISGTPTLGGSYTYTATVTPPITRSSRTAPSLITPASTFADAVSQNGYGFEYSGKLYLFTYRDTDNAGTLDNHFRCLQSTDSGATWTEILGPQWPFTLGAFLNAGWPVAYSVARDGTNVILIWVNATKDTTHLNWTDFSISKVVFDLTANTWGSVTTVPAPFYGLMDNQNQSPATDHSNGATIHLIVRGPGDYLVYVPGAESGSSGSMRGTATVVPYNGSSFGGAMPIPGQTAGKWYVPCGSVYDPASGNTHFLMAGGNTSGGQPKLFHAALSSGNSYGSMTAIMDNAVTPGDWNAGTSTAADGVSQPIIYSDGVDRKIGIATSVFGPSPPFSVYVRFFSAIETLNPTFTHSEITTEQWPVTVGDIPRFGIHAEVFSLATNGTTMIATWVSYDGSESDPSDIYYSTTPVAGALTWTAPAVVIPTPLPLSGTSGPEPYVNVQGLAISMTGGFGVVGHAQNASFHSPYLVSQFSFVAADDGGGGGGTIDPVSVTCSMNVGYGHLSTSCGAPPVYTQGVAGAAYRPPVVMGAIGLPPVYDQNHTLIWTFPVVPPAGMHWETNPASPNYGYLVGTPTLSGVQNFTYTVFAPDGQSVTNTCPLTVEPGDDGGGGGGGGGGPLHIFCDNPPGGKVGIPYNHTFPVVGATGPTTYSVVVGALPPGVHLDPATGDLSGTPTAPGTYSFSVKVQQ